MAEQSSQAEGARGTLSQNLFAGHLFVFRGARPIWEQSRLFWPVADKATSSLMLRAIPAVDASRKDTQALLRSDLPKRQQY